MTDSGNLHFLDDRTRAEHEKSPGTKLMDWLRQAQVAPPEPIGDQEVTELPGDPPPRFRTGLREWEDKTDGGGYGCTCIAGPPKCGKSMLALSCAIEAAAMDCPWRVLYFNAELSRYEMANRLRNYLGGEPNERLADQLSIHPVEIGVTLEHLWYKVGERICLEDERMLLIFDSLNRIVEQSEDSLSDARYWGTMRRWVSLCRIGAKISGGRLASIVVAERARAGHVKGQQVEFAADLVLMIGKDGDEDYEIEIPHARSSAGGKLGKFWLNHTRGRFICVATEE